MGKKKRAELREEMKLILANLDNRWLKAASVEVCERLSATCQLNQQLQHILLFQPLLHGSVDLTTFLVEQLKSGRRVYIPCDMGSTGFFEVERESVAGMSLADLKTAQCSRLVEEPFMIDDAKGTVVVLPGLAFDTLGNRIGWGSLNYETLMSRPGMGRAQTIGVCWSLQLLDELPSNSTDLLVEQVVHERGVVATGTGALSRTAGVDDEVLV